MAAILFPINIGFYSLCKSFNADLIRFACLFAPVPCSRLTHEFHVHQNFYYLILNKIKILSGFFPCLSIAFAKSFFKFLIMSLFRQFSFQIRKKWNGSAKALHFMKHFQKHIYYCILILFAIGITF